MFIENYLNENLLYLNCDICKYLALFSSKPSKFVGKDKYSVIKFLAIIRRGLRFSKEILQLWFIIKSISNLTLCYKIVVVILFFVAVFYFYDISVGSNFTQFSNQNSKIYVCV